MNELTIEEGLLIIQAQGNVIRFVPPLIVEEKHKDFDVAMVDIDIYSGKIQYE